MKIKTLINLAFSNIRSRKKVYIIMGMVVFMISSLFICGQTLYTNQYQSQKTRDQADYGIWYDLYVGTDKQSFEESIKTNYGNNNELTYGFINTYGNTNHMEILGYVEKDDYQNCGIHIIEGTQVSSASTKDGRLNIVVDEDFFENYNIPRSINQEVTVEYKNYQKENVQLKAYIVGISDMKDELFAKNNFPTILFCQPLKESESRVNAFVDRSINGEKIVYTEIVPNVKGYDTSVMGTFLETVALLNFMIVCVGVGSIVIVGVTYASLKSKGKDLTLLRGIGATKKQLLLMILFECLVIYGIALILSILSSIGICYLIMNVIEKDFYINSTLSLDAFIVGGVCSAFVALIGFFVPVSYTMKNALSGAFDHPNFQYFQIRYRKLRKQHTTQLAYRSLSVRKRFTAILILATIIPIYCFAQLQNTIGMSEQENQNFLNSEITSLDKYIALWDTDIEIDKDVVTQLKQYTNNIQTSPIYTLDRDSLLLKGYEKNNSIQIANDPSLCVIDENYVKTIASSKYQGRFPENDNEVFLTNRVFDLWLDNNLDSTSVVYEIGDTINVKGKQLKVVGFMDPKSYQKVEDYTVYGYTTNYLKEDALYVRSSAYQTLTKQSPNKMNFLKVFTNDENYQDISFIMTQYSYQMKVRLHDSSQSIDDLIDNVMGVSEDKIKAEFLMSIEMACGALIIYGFMNYYDIMSHKKDYALLKILGATKLDLIMIQLKKALMITGFSSFMTFVFLAVDFNSRTLSYIGYILLVSIPVLIIMSLMYVLPILSLFKQPPLEVLDIEE